MVARAKQTGARVELISNAMLLNEKRARGLIEAGLDMLWVSLDGATPESYVDVRLGAALERVVANLERFHSLRMAADHKPELGIAFVAMRSNIGDLPGLLRLGNRLGAARYSVSGVLPHTAEMHDEILYTRTLGEGQIASSAWAPQVSLPRMDMNETTRDALFSIMRSGQRVSIGGANLGEGINRCPFIEKGATVVGWDGRVSPCLPLLHSHISYLIGQERATRRYIVDNMHEHSLRDIWLAPEYTSFRRRVQEFDFSPCATCGGCNFSNANEEDCSGNLFPTCGGCLWAQGVIQCP